MQDELIAEWANRLATADTGDGLPHRTTVLAIARHVMLCLVHGGLHFGAQVPAASVRPSGEAHWEPVRNLFGPGSLLGEALFLGTVGGSSDLDPMDPAPAHTALPVVVAALVLARRGAPTEDAVLAAIGAGLEAGACCSNLVNGRTPGVGYHSAGLFGTLAAAAASARLLGLSPSQVRTALGIAATRAAGLAVNSRWPVGMTHFGWAAAHGIEAAILAGDGWRGHPDEMASIRSLLGISDTGDPSALSPAGSLAERRGMFYKLYPCNVYLNLAAVALSRLDLAPDAVRTVTVELPPVRHLDNPHAQNARERRNSLQSVVAEVLRSRHPGRMLVGPPAALDSCAIAARFNPDIPADLRRTRVSVSVTLASGETVEVSQDATILDAPDDMWANQLVAGSPRGEATVHRIWALPLSHAWQGVIKFLQEEVAPCALLGQS